MSLCYWSRGALAVALGLIGPGAVFAQNFGAVRGFVEDSHGDPVAGAVISVFGRGLGGGGAVTSSDSAGRFYLPSLPPGSYTLRALGDGHQPAPARQITVLPRRDSTFKVSLSPAAEAAADGAAPESLGQDAAAGAAAAPVDTAEGLRELRWVLRHRRRSVLEEASPGYRAAGADRPSTPAGLADLGGTVELMTSPSRVGLGTPTIGVESRPASLSSVQFNGRLADSARWSLSGLVAESEGTAWRVGAEFALDPVPGHHVQVGSGYGMGVARTMGSLEARSETRNVGALFARDEWDMGERVRGTMGARFSYIGFLERSTYVDPAVSLEVQPDSRTRATAGISRHTLVPGGDLLTLSTLASPAIAFAVMENGLRAEADTRLEVSLEQTRGPFTLRAQTFYEDVRNQLANTYDGPGPVRSLHIDNAGGMAARGLAVSVTRRFGTGLMGSVTYTLGRAWRDAPGGPTRIQELLTGVSSREADYHDVVARLEAFVKHSDTHLTAFYRLNTLTRNDDEHVPVTSSRFDVQVSQGLPFMGEVMHADWDLLLAVRNLYYEPSEGAVLDELAVLNPPRRVMGGISVRF